MTTDQHPGRRVVANISLSLDGRANGRAGDHDMSWIVPHAISDTAREHMVRITGSATTALLGRKNFEGFGGFSAWLNATEKVVFTRTPSESSWTNSRTTAADPAQEVARLRNQDGGDIVVLASISVIRALLDADEVDRLSITLCPHVAGGGAPLFTDGLPATDWSLVDLTTAESGAICLLYDRMRSTP
jgi:dihydrofolate reductase